MDDEYYDSEDTIHYDRATIYVLYGDIPRNVVFNNMSFYVCNPFICVSEN